MADPTGGDAGAEGAPPLPETAAGTAAEGADEFQLAHEFYDIYRACDRIAKRDGDDFPEQQDLEGLASRIRAVAFRVRELRLFSPNEELDDISTADLKFLLVPFLLAQVTSATRDLSRRLEWLRNALVFWRGFAADCQRLGIGHDADLRAIDRSPEDALDPASKRTEKVERYRRSKELDTKVAYLFSRKREVLGDEYLWGAGGAFDEDMERELILALLSRAVGKAAEEIASTEQELPMLEMMLERGGPGGAPEPPRQYAASEKPWVLRIQDKAELTKLYQEMVFQCPYQLPTISLAECADYEISKVQEQKQRQAEQEQAAAAEEADRWWGGDRQGAREAAEEEQQVYKDRDWDDWKDEHPYGCGNKMANLG